MRLRFFLECLAIARRRHFSGARFDFVRGARLRFRDGRPHACACCGECVPAFDELRRRVRQALSSGEDSYPRRARRRCSKDDSCRRLIRRGSSSAASQCVLRGEKMVAAGVSRRRSCFNAAGQRLFGVAGNVVIFHGVVNRRTFAFGAFAGRRRETEQQREHRAALAVARRSAPTRSPCEIMRSDSQPRGGLSLRRRQPELGSRLQVPTRAAA